MFSITFLKVFVQGLYFVNLILQCTKALRGFRPIAEIQYFDYLLYGLQTISDDLDSAPRTLTANEHRPAYATDGDYFSNPNAEDVFELAYEMMHETDPFEYSLYQGFHPSREFRIDV
ncbi:MAG: hypothetical protein KAS71_18625 [Bacteroidales bacterium]|nr:hypothetical protein [Bacteroidales bacterium]